MGYLATLYFQTNQYLKFQQADVFCIFRNQSNVEPKQFCRKLVQLCFHSTT